MKHLFQTAVIVLAVAASMTACKKQTLSPDAPGPMTAPEGGIEAGIEPNTNQAFIDPSLTIKLVRKGNDSLVYDNSGKLSKVIYSPTSYITYQKTGNLLTATRFDGNVMKAKVEYKLDNGGKTYESKHSSFESNVIVTSTYSYVYDGQNRLIKKYDKQQPNVRAEFIWGSAGLAQVRWYNLANVEVRFLQFSRNLTDDKLKLNSPRTGLDPYIKVFGARSEKTANYEQLHFPQNPAQNIDEYFYFTYNRHGFPTKCEIANSITWVWFKTETYSYVD